jgi:ribosome recycling factor
MLCRISNAPRIASSVATAAVAACLPLFVQRRHIASPSRVLMKDVRRHDFGDSRRLSFEERSDKRAGKSKDQKVAREQLLAEAEQFAESEFPEDLERVFEKVQERSNMLSLRILNIVKCIECLEMELPSGAPKTARKPLLLQIANVVKTKPNELEVTPTVSSMASSVLTRISRFDGSLLVSKEQNKIRVVVPPMTTARRDKAASDIRGLLVDFKQKVKIARQNASRVLSSIGVDDAALRTLNDLLDSKVTEFVEDKSAEIENVAAEVVSMGVDEADDQGAAS